MVRYNFPVCLFTCYTLLNFRLILVIDIATSVLIYNIHCIPLYALMEFVKCKATVS